MKPLLILLLLFPFLLLGQDKSQQVEKIISDYLSLQGPGTSIIVTKDQQVLYTNSFGLSEVSMNKKIQASDLFRIGSVTKQFTAAAILNLAHNKVISLDDPLDKYFAYDSNNKEISIRQLLQHTSGLGNQSDLPGFNPDSIKTANYPENVVNQILQSSLKFPAGSNYSYSNLGYILLGQIIEKAAKMPFESYLDEVFFQPLNMNNTGFEYRDPSKTPMSKGYSLVAGKHAETKAFKMKIAYSAGGMVSTTNDLAKWNSAIMSGQVLPLAYVKQLQTSSLLPSKKPTGYSLGWQIGNIQGLKTVKHDGIVNGFTSMTIYVPETKLFVAVLSNCDCFRDIEQPASKIAALFMERPFPSQAIDLTEVNLEKFQGKYNNNDAGITIAVHDHNLMYYRRGGSKKELLPVGVNKFQLAGSLDQIEFHLQGSEATYTLTSLNEISHWKRVENVDAYNSLALADSKCEEYVGKYQVPGAFVFEITRIDNSLFGQIGADRKELFCFQADKFSTRETDAELEFSRDQENRVTTLTLHLDRELVATKIE